jgi:hypothetical protein
VRDQRLASSLGSSCGPTSTRCFRPHVDRGTDSCGSFSSKGPPPRPPGDGLSSLASRLHPPTRGRRSCFGCINTVARRSVVQDDVRQCVIREDLDGQARHERRRALQRNREATDPYRQLCPNGELGRMKCGCFLENRDGLRHEPALDPTVAGSLPRATV